MTLLTPMNALRLAMTDISVPQSQLSDKVSSTYTAQPKLDAPAKSQANASDEWWLEFN